MITLTTLFLNRLVLSDLVLGRGDTFAYFYPYWDIRNQALLDGHFPLWSPHLFMGVPLLANSQLGTLYPLNWMVSSFTPAVGVKISIVIHMTWAWLGTAFLIRKLLPQSGWIPAFTGGMIYAFSGHLGAHIEQINQFQGLAWLPWIFALLLYCGEQPKRYILPLAFSFALQFLIGHTQTVFITGIGAGILALGQSQPVLRKRMLISLGIAGILALILASPQILPTMELTRVSNRGGGLNANEATAFSLSPLMLGRGLLPSYDTYIFSEYIGYVGVFALGLTWLALAQIPLKRSVRHFWRRPEFVWMLLLIVGIGFALGFYNPLYYALASLPGFNLFRVPSRWLALLTIACAVLSAYGLYAVQRRHFQWDVRRILSWTLGLGALAGLSLLVTRAPEISASVAEPITWLMWALTGAGVIFLLSIARRYSSLALALIVVAIGAELFFTARAQTYNDVTAPEVIDTRRFETYFVEQLQSERLDAGRVLSISDIFFDPGDHATLVQRYQTLGLSETAIRTALVDIKMQQTLTANLPLMYGIYSVDGYDGGVLPTLYYTQFTSLLTGDQTRTVDGRLREILARDEACRGACIPELRWLGLMNVQYLLTDKVHDLWRENIAYDTQFAQPITADERRLYASGSAFVTTAVDVLYSCAEGVTCNPPRMVGQEDEFVVLDTLAPFTLARFTLSEPQALSNVELTSTQPMTLQAVTLVDLRADLFQPLTPAHWHRLLSSDIKLYEYAETQPRAQVMSGQIYVMPNTWQGSEDALDLMAQPDFDPARDLVIHSDETSLPTHASQADVTLIEYDDERVVLQVDNATQAGWLLLTDAYDVGWQVRVNDQPAALYRADVMFRAVMIPEGTSTVTFTYQPSWYPHLFILGAGVWMVALLVGVLFWLRTSSKQPSH